MPAETSLPNDVRYEYLLILGRIAELDADLAALRSLAAEALALTTAPPALTHKPYFGVVHPTAEQLAWLESAGAR